jgi:ABC-2 type transport system ATP-binding protein
VLSEVEQIADEILVISRGELKFAGTMEALADPRTGPVVVDAADREGLSQTLQDAGYDFEILRSGLTVRGSDAATIGGITTRAGIALTTLQQRGPTLEDVFLDLVHDRYVPPAPAPVAEQTTVLDLPSADEAVAPESADDAQAPEAVESDETVETTETTDADAEDDVPQDGRPLPGLADLAAVASMFATPVTDPSGVAAIVEAEQAAEAEQAEEADSAPEQR